MGKKPQKTKEVWAAIAEASSTIDEQQPQPTRKRGRPRKIVVKMESSEEKAEENKEEGTKTSSEVEACMVRKEEGGEQEIQLVPKGVSVSVSCRSSRARRKSKPIKSSTQ
ncbi:putative AT hook, DNA-binding protein [Medicago truncatula]|uniref:Putative AT hook, DNA-binding protein n=1 Tax=Medicago truncatula TaxID=3880 RepID=I3SX70_MEDTR|nr:uncharacterized protein LOC112421287 [Medicago truncatula]AFK44862.1 unknown [Medicago truncatula]RHN77463.1 putative AT hook, DNA-binding protein [Medicago truncatula]